VLAVDTNVLIRIVTDDEPLQVERARRFVAGNDVFVGVTVLLESGWVLEHHYGLSPREVVQGLRLFAGLPTVALESREEVSQALVWCEAGMDLADAMHLALGRKLEGFATFDRGLLSFARAQGLSVVEP
jgi:predicted nucleic acid-binding protein